MCKNSHVPKYNWDDLRAFLSVVRVGKLTGAARELGLDHSTLSRRISNLETVLNITLFERSPGGYKITEAGKWLAVEAENMENSAVRIQAYIENENHQVTGPVRITMPEGLSSSFFVHQLSILKKNHPEVTIELIANPQIFSLTKREADIAVMMERPTQGPLVSRKLCDYEYGLYCSHDYQLANKAIRSKDELEDHFVIGYIDDLLPTPVHAYLKHFMPNRDADLQISNILTQVEATVSGIGIALLPCFMASRHPSLVRLLPDEISFLRSYWIATHEMSRHPIRTRIAKDFIIDQMEENSLFFWPSKFKKTATK